MYFSISDQDLRNSLQLSVCVTQEKSIDSYFDNQSFSIIGLKFKSSNNFNTLDVATEQNSGAGGFTANTGCSVCSAVTLRVRRYLRV